MARKPKSINLKRPYLSPAKRGKINAAARQGRARRRDRNK
jgi:hypothetical protein